MKRWRFRAFPELLLRPSPKGGIVAMDLTSAPRFMMASPLSGH
jgi:hypothetical protein